MNFHHDQDGSVNKALSGVLRLQELQGKMFLRDSLMRGIPIFISGVDNYAMN